MPARTAHEYGLSAAQYGFSTLFAALRKAACRSGISLMREPFSRLTSPRAEAYIPAIGAAVRYGAMTRL
jgi:hypothetical protein